MVPGRGECRIVRDGQKAEDRYSLGLGPEEIVALNRLLLTPEGRLDGRSIEDWFVPAFFGTNFWIMWSTMFSFQPWHSVAEMRRYMRRFLHLFPGLSRIEGILRTRYNQYDSIVGPILAWLSERGVDLRTASSVADVTIEGDVTNAALTSRDVYQAVLTAAGYGKITTEIAPLEVFYPAEDNHQDYLAKNPNGYCGLGGTGEKFPNSGWERSPGGVH